MKLNSESNTGQTFWLASGQFIALCLTIGSTVILTRYMDKYNYGTYKQVFYVYTTLLSVFTLGLPKAYGYFLPRMSKEEGKDFITKLTILFILLGSVFSLLLFLGAPIIAKILKNEELIFATRLFSPVPIFLMPTLGLEAIYATYKETQMAALYSIATRVLLFLCVTIPAFIFKITYREAIIGFLISSFLSFVLALYLKNRPFKGIEKVKSRVSYKEIIYFCVPLMMAGIFNILINSTDQFFISRYFGTEAFAEFSNGAMELPFVGMIVGACSTVLLPVYSRITNDKVITVEGRDCIISTWNNVLKKTVMLIYPLVIYCLVYSGDIMVVLYGEQYLISGKYFFIMLFNNFMSVISCYPLLLALNKTKEYSIVYFISFILLAIFEYTVIHIFSTVQSVCIISVLNLWIRIVVLLSIIAHHLNISIKRLFPFKTIVVVCSLSITISILLHNAILVENHLLSLCISFPLFIALLLGFSKIAKLDYFAIVKPLINKHGS